MVEIALIVTVVFEPFEPITLLDVGPAPPAPTETLMVLDPEGIEIGVIITPPPPPPPPVQLLPAPPPATAKTKIWFATVVLYWIVYAVLVVFKAYTVYVTPLDTTFP